jgi:hypothetical protein
MNNKRRSVRTLNAKFRGGNMCLLVKNKTCYRRKAEFQHANISNCGGSKQDPRTVYDLEVLIKSPQTATSNRINSSSRHETFRLQYI